MLFSNRQTTCIMLALHEPCFGLNPTKRQEEFGCKLLIVSVGCVFVCFRLDCCWLHQVNSFLLIKKFVWCSWEVFRYFRFCIFVAHSVAKSSLYFSVKVCGLCHDAGEQPIISWYDPCRLYHYHLDFRREDIRRQFIGTAFIDTDPFSNGLLLALERFCRLMILHVFEPVKQSIDWKVQCQTMHVFPHHSTIKWSDAKFRQCTDSCNPNYRKAPCVMRCIYSAQWSPDIRHQISNQDFC